MPAFITLSLAIIPSEIFDLYFPKLVFVTWIFYILLILYLVKRYLDLSRVTDLKVENLKEEINTLSQQIKEQKNTQSSLSQKTIYYNNLREITTKIQNLSLEDVSGYLVNYAYKSLGKQKGTCLLYLVDPEHKSLNLFLSQKEKSDLVIKQKQGDVFDRWVIKHATSLLVEDSRSDFRFDMTKAESSLKRPVYSLISAPLKVEQRFLGLLRLDNDVVHSYAQDDLRFLDVICNVGALALENALLFKRTQELGIKDSLTSLYTKGHFLDCLNEQIRSLVRLPRKHLSLFMIDIDNFKDYNDRYGHIAGDIVLKGLGNVFLEFFSTIPGAMICRFGGEEFSVSLPNIDKKSSQRLADDLRLKVEEGKFVLRLMETRVTISIGVSFLSSGMTNAQDLILKADTALYRAKQKGKNQVCGM